MQAATVYIGALPVGPVCARRIGLIAPARKNADALRLGTWPWRRRKPQDEGQRTLDLFPEVVHG